MCDECEIMSKQGMSMQLSCDSCTDNMAVVIAVKIVFLIGINNRHVQLLAPFMH